MNLLQGGSRGRVQGVRTPPPRPEMTCGFLIKYNWCLCPLTSQLHHSLVVHPLIKKILDPPLFHDNPSTSGSFTWKEVDPLDSEDDFRSGCRNVSHQQQFFSELPSPRRSHNTNLVHFTTCTYWLIW